MKFCEKKGNADKLTKWPSFYTKGLSTVGWPIFPLNGCFLFHWPPKRDKYNKNIFKYYVEVDEEDEDVDVEEEREKEEHTMDVRAPVLFNRRLLSQNAAMNEWILLR